MDTRHTPGCVLTVLRVQSLNGSVTGEGKEVRAKLCAGSRISDSVASKDPYQG